MANEVAQSIVDVATGAELSTRCLITDMNSVLGHNVGNSVEVLECIEFLTSPTKANPRLLKLTLDLAAHMIQISGLESDFNAAYLKAETALNNGMAAEKFAEMVSALGGPTDLLSNPLTHLTPTPIIKAIPAKKSGYVTSMDVRRIGLSLVSLNAGRIKSTDSIDHSVGLSGVVQIGQLISVGDPLALAHVRNSNDVDFLQDELYKAIHITEDISSNEPSANVEDELIYDIITPKPS
jgi:thymidine phosphorylase